MTLEDRVQALEDEIKVLKNEIQLTLLDIHEQILIHYYPSLRSSMGNESAHERPPHNIGHLAPGHPNGHHQPANGPGSANGYAAESSIQPATPSAGPAGEPDEDDLDDEDVIDTLIAAVPTSLAAIKSNRSAPPANVAHASSLRPPQADSGLAASEQAGSMFYRQPAASGPSIPRLLAWVRQGIDAIGSSQTREIIDMYAGSGFLAEDLAGVLRQLVDLAPGGAAPQMVSAAQVAVVMAGLNEVIASSTEGVSGG